MNSYEALLRLPLPVVVILGATGTGKSKLAVTLAQKFKGEVISADSMQVYKDLDILTNKVTVDEMKGIPHHMISIVKPCEKFDVTHFRKQALPIVERVLAEGKIPFIVGGTNYYIESLLWKVLIDEKDNASKESTNLTSGEAKKRKIETSPHSDDGPEKYTEILNLFQKYKGNIEEDELPEYSSTQLYAALQQIDEERANRLHPNDRRKVMRSLQVRYQTGRRHSEILSEQRDRESATGEVGSSSAVSHLGGPLRFPNCICFWIQADREVLDIRINSRVEEMVTRGLRQELEEYIKKLKLGNSTLDFTKGLLQSIGFKEFSAYLQLEPNDWNTEVGNQLFQDGIELLQIATRQYARKQIKWINQRFLRPSRRQVVPVYWLDSTFADPRCWELNVEVPALSILQSCLGADKGNPFLEERLVPQKEEGEDDLIARICEVCDNRTFLGSNQWHAHLKGHRHKKMVKRRKDNESRAVAIMTNINEVKNGDDSTTLSN